MRSKSLSTANLQNHQPQLSRSPGGTIDHEDEDEEDHDEFFDAMSEHPEAFGMESTDADQPGNDPYSDYDDLSDNVSLNTYLNEKNENDDDGSGTRLNIRRSFSEKLLEHAKAQEFGHRRAVSQDMQGQEVVSYLDFLKRGKVT